MAPGVEPTPRSPLPHPLPRDGLRPARDEQMRRRLPCRRAPAAHRAGKLCTISWAARAQRHDALLIALAADQHIAEVELQVFELHVDRLPRRAGLRHRRPPAWRDRAHASACDMRSSLHSRRPLQHAAQPPSGASDFGSTFHCRGESMFSVGSVVDVAVEQQVLVEVSQRRELARYAARRQLRSRTGALRKSRTSCRRASLSRARLPRNSAYCSKSER